jgi:hypothetical protein
LPASPGTAYGYRDVAAYLDMIGRDTCARLSRTATGCLLDPYRQWVLPAEGAGA